MIEEFLPSFCWSLIGFLLGWLSCREMLFISQIREAVVPKEERERTDQKTQANSRLLGWVVVLLAVVSVLQGSYYTWQNQKVAQCQASYNADFAKVLRLRAQWADEDKKAESKLFSDFLGAKPGTGRNILQEYLDVTNRTDKLRQETPLPKLEDRDC